MAVSDIITTFPWLRSDPASLSGEPPSKITAVGGSKWEQVFIEWLRGTTANVVNTTAIDDSISEEEVFQQFMEMSFPKTTGERRTELAAKFQGPYGSFRHDIGRIQKILADRVTEIRQQAKAEGKDVPDARDARKQAGHETAKAAVQQQVKEQSATLGNINVALVANLQLKTFQVTALQEFKNALNGFGEAKWDVVPENPEEDSGDTKVIPSPEKEQAMAALGAAGTAMFAAYGKVSSAIAQITKLDGADIPEKTANELTESLLEFGQAIAAQADSMGQAGRLFGKWARRTTREFIRNNFNSIYPGVAVGFFALRTLAAAGAAVASTFPGYGSMVGTAVKVAEQELEMGAVYLTSWHEGQSTEVQKKFALREFQITDEYRDGFFDRANNAKNAVDGFVEKIKDKTIGQAKTKLAVGMRSVADAGIGRMKVDDIVRHAGELGELLGPITDVAKEQLKIPSLDVADLLADASPGFAAAKNVAGVFFDFASLYVAIHSELVDRSGITAEQRALIEALIDAPPQNEGYHLFARGKPVELVQPVGYPVVHVRSGGIGFSLDLETNYVHIVDEGLMSAEIVGYAKKWAKNPPNDNNGLRYLGAVYTPDWGSWQLDFGGGKNSPFHATIQAVHSTASEDKVVNLHVAVDLDLDEVAITASDYVPRPEGLDGIMEFNAAPPADGKFAALSGDQLLARFADRPVVFGPTEYTLSAAGAVTFAHADDWSSLTFTMLGVDADGATATLDLEYLPGQSVRAVNAVVAAGSAQADLAAADPLIAANEARQNTPEAQAKLAAGHADLAARTEADAKNDAKAAKALAEQAPKDARHAAQALAHAEKDAADLAKKAAAATKAAEEAKQKAGTSPAAAADAGIKASLAEQAAQAKADADAAVVAAAEAKSDADAAVLTAKADAEAKAAKAVAAAEARKQADANLKIKVKAGKAKQPKQKTGLTLAGIK
ncbi:hypothetical protein [Actinokineospora sp.]|uniref:hypothetical protein n=1 Tax=Actinokineospora sp. TaxID=1872133 RepID=UPI00403796DD